MQSIVQRFMFVFCIILLMFTSACGVSENIVTTESKLLQYYSIGNPSTVVGTLSVPIQNMSKEAQFPFKPVGVESTGAYFSDVWSVDNGGTASGSTGNLNRITFMIYRVNNGGNDYYVAEVDVIYTDGVGHVVYQPQTAVVTAWPRDHVQMYWSGGYIHLYVLNQIGQLTWDLPPVPFAFFAGVMPTKSYSPRILFGLDTSQAYGGCMRDIPNYDDSTNDTGHYKVQNRYGASQPSFTAYLSSPTTNSKCDLKIIDHNTTYGYDLVQWQVSGF